MKYALNAAPIAGPRKQFGAGPLAMTLTPLATLKKATTGAGTIAMVLAALLSGRVFPRTTGAMTVQFGLAGNFSGVFFFQASMPLALALQDASNKPIAVKAAGVLPLVLSLRYGLPATVLPRAGFDPIAGRCFTVPADPRGFTVQPDSVEPVRATEGFAVPDQGGL